MFGVLDLVTVTMIEKRIEHFKNNPDWLEYILCGYHGNRALFDMVGAEYIKQSIEYISQTKINVLPYYNPDLKQSPSISVIVSGNEHQQYIGELGFQELAPASKQTVMSNPIVVAEWNAKSIDGNVMSVPPELSLDTKLWPGIIITNGTVSAVLDGIVDASTLCLKEDLPAGIEPRGWRAQTAGSNKIYNISSSTDSVSVQCKLTSHGEPGNHRLLGLLLRASLKSSLLNFDKIGFQNTKISYTPMVLTNQEEMEYESVYSIDGVFTETWIASEVQGPDSASNIGVSTTATNKDTSKGDVKL